MSDSIVIVPTVGRVVWFYLHTKGSGHKGPMAAIVAKVHKCCEDDECYFVNLMVVNDSGESHARNRVPLVQECCEAPEANYCSWMPYQIGQVKKHAADAEESDSKKTESSSSCPNAGS